MRGPTGNTLARVALWCALWCGAIAVASGQSFRLEFPDNRATYQQIFAEIEKQGGVWFAYMSQDFEGTGQIEVPQDSQLSLGEILDFIFKDTDYKYEVDGKHIFITKQEPPPNYDVPPTHIRVSVNPGTDRRRAGARELVRPAVDSTFKEVRPISGGDPLYADFDGLERIGSGHTAHPLFTVENLSIEPQKNDVAISFEIDIALGAVDKKSVAYIIPMIGMQADGMQLPGIVVEDHRTAWLRKRGEIVQDMVDMPEGSVHTISGASIRYSASIPLDSIKIGSDLWLVVSREDRNGSVIEDITVLAEDFVGEGHVEVPPIYRTVPHTESDLLVQKYTFLAPLGEFEEQSEANRDDFVADSRGSSLTVYFRPGWTKIDPSFRDNAASLEYIADAISALREAEQTGSSKISHIIVAGYSSPEGELALNRYLSYLRATALRDHLAAETGIDPSIVDIYNGGIDWPGLRHRVENSDLPEKEEVVALIGTGIDMTDEQEEELYEKLRRLNGGSTYNKLFREIFPELRVATYLRIYYENLGAR